MLFLTLLSCAPKEPPPPPLPPAPILPAPDGELYATGISEPRDPLIAQAVSVGLPWQESLSGAATALALEQPFAPELSNARWAAVRSGYPHPVRSLLVASVRQDNIPETLLAELQRLLVSGDQIGLVRARSGGSDRWVALIGRPRVTIGAFQRELPLGAALSLKTDAEGWRLLSPSSVETSGLMSEEPILSEPGEWWLELTQRSNTVLSVPLHVDMDTPPAPILTLPGEPTPSPTEASALAYELVNSIRDAFDLPHLQIDPTLETLAGYPLELSLAGSWEKERGEARLRAAGFVGGPVGQLTCEGRTVAVCIDTLMWSIDERAVLLHPGLRLTGIQAQVTTEGISMALNAASE
ncbi:MAG: hypothetical protein P8R54_11185 [Myxococcota bacterium]|nr:hypothetical protein [Myxococcota bacterium]